MNSSETAQGSTEFPVAETKTNDPVLPTGGENTLHVQITFDNNTAKKIAGMVASKIPYAGGVISGLISVFWPTTEVSLWDQIKDQVSVLIDQKIAAYNYKQLEQSLQGLHLAVDRYAVITNPAQKLAAAVAIEKDIEAMLPKYLSGDPASGFSLFWSIALLHLSLRKDLCDMVKNSNDAANDQLLHKYIVMYCTFARVAITRIYHKRLEEVRVLAESTNVPGKNSDWFIDVDVTDTKTGTRLFAYNQMYRKGKWDENLLNERTVYCNNEIQKKYLPILPPIQQQMMEFAIDAVTLLEKDHAYTQEEGLAQLKLGMTEADYKEFLDKYYPVESIYLTPKTTKPVKKTPNPVVQLNPFKKG